MDLVEACTKNGAVRRTFRLDPSRAYSIGRSPRCEICLPFGSVSRRHAALFCHAGVWRVLDCGSRRGVEVEGMDVHQTTLRPDRPVRIGPLWLRLRVGGAGPSRRTGTNGVRGFRQHGWIGITRDARMSDGAAHTGHDPLNAKTLDMPAMNSVDRDDGVDGDSGGSQSGRVGARHSAGAAEVLVVESGDCVLGIFDLCLVDHVSLGTDPHCRIQLPLRPGVLPLHALLLRESRLWSAIDAGGGLVSEGNRYLRRRLRAGVGVELGTLRIRVAGVTLVEPTSGSGESAAVGADAAGNPFADDDSALS